MQQQSEKKAALYYRVASKHSGGLYLDNQMQKLLCYTYEHGIDSFMLYAEIGVSGHTLDRPVFNTLKADIEAGRVNKLIVSGFDRIARDALLVGTFIKWAQARGVEIISVIDSGLAFLPFVELYALYCRFQEGGGQL